MASEDARITLSDIRFNAASVMPVVWRHSPNQPPEQPPEQYVLLSREAGGKDKGTYDDWGGSRDKGDKHPIVTAAREFLEEAITQKTLGMEYSAIKDYIAVKNGRTHFVVAQEGVGGRSTMVTYITEFEPEKISELTTSFYKVRQKERRWKYKEKDCLAFVAWKDLDKTLRDSRYASNVTISAYLIDNKTGSLTKEVVKLRPAFVAKLRSFFRAEPHICGESEKILLYKAKPRAGCVCKEAPKEVSKDLSVGASKGISTLVKE